MIKKTRIKFTVILVLSLIILLSVLLININFAMNKIHEENITRILFDLLQGDEAHPKSDYMLAQDWFVVRIGNDKEIIDVVSNSKTVTTEDIHDYTLQYNLTNMPSGQIDNYNYQSEGTEYGEIIAFVNIKTEEKMINDLSNTTVKIGIFSVGVILLLAYFLSKIITKPLEEAIEKQKTFISDASHEIKTPLSIIKVNASILKDKIDDDENLLEIDLQSNRISDLITNLLSLTRIENANLKLQFEDFELSKVIIHTIQSLEVLAYENGKILEYNIRENIVYNGNEKNIIKMIEALVDNAIKYANMNSTINITFYQERNKSVFEIRNECDAISKDECIRIFDEFYRLDKSRTSETGGFGMGLSVVKGIVEKHNAVVNAEYKNGSLLIKVVL